MQWIKNAWRGETKLWKAFWVYGILGGFLVPFVFGLLIGIGFGAYSISQAMSPEHPAVDAGSVRLKLLLGLALEIVPLIYIFWASIVIWKCAFNARLKFWGYLARAWVILIVGYACYQIYDIAIVRSVAGTQNAFEECKDQKKDVSSQIACLCTKKSEYAALATGENPQTYVKSHQADIEECVQTTSSRAGIMSKAIDKIVRAAHDDGKTLCETYMTATAKKAGVDPQKYIAVNQAYLQECAKSMNTHLETLRKNSQ